MASRRDRTTALPRPRQRLHHSDRRTVMGVPWGERESRLAILGSITLLLVVILGALSYNWYQDNVQRPNTIVVRVGEEKYKLRYYADRLVEFARANPGTSLLVVEQSLLSKLEEEGLTIELAKDKGIVLSDDDVTVAIAAKLGVPVGGDGSAFDIRYRDQLRTLDMSDGNYRKLIRAETTDTRLRELLSKELGTTGELVTIRAAVLGTKAEAEDALAKVKGGQDLGTVAQTVSVDSESKVNDGIFTPSPAALLPEAIQKEIDGKAAGTLIEQVVESEGRFYVMKVESRDPAGVLTAGQVSELVDKQFLATIAAKRADLQAKGELSRKLDGDDIAWAVAHAGSANDAASSTSATVVTSP